MARIIVLTGERGVGKTTVCRKTIALAQAEGYACGGILTLSHANDVRELLDVHSGDVRRLTARPDADSSVVQGRFRFDPETLDWGDGVLVRGVPCDLLVVDELGPLEIERKRGWAGAFDVLREADFALALVVVRPELVTQAQQRLPGGATRVLTVTPASRDRLPSVLLEMLKRETKDAGRRT